MKDKIEQPFEVDLAVNWISERHENKGELNHVGTWHFRYKKLPINTEIPYKFRHHTLQFLLLPVAYSPL